ncbi:MAG: SCO family protein [Bacteroidetes bacterium]|nr:SCO family protein [Bacteroidota bacterium]MBU1578645.1 SCO family protein [Bacteroidota bacterium]MBU2556153.1 SCO family protein [Bacteroidota bacterium]
MRFLRFFNGAGLGLLILFAGLFSTLQAAEELGVYERLDQYIQDDIVFTDENFNQINIKNAIDKPTIIAMVYYECPGICTPLLNGLADVMKKSDLELGEDYQVFTISFSHAEKTVLAQRKKKTYTKLVGKGDLENGWHFFTGDSLNIDRFLDNIGYKVKQEGEEFIHPATLVVISPEGKITRYLHGTDYLPFDMKMAIVEAGMERSGPTINKILDYCFSYDAEGKKYVFNVTKVSGSIILILALVLLGSLLLSNRKKKTNHAH